MRKLAIAVLALGVAIAILLLVPVYRIDTPPCTNLGSSDPPAICLPIFAYHTPVFKSVSCVMVGVGAIYVPRDFYTVNSPAKYHLGCFP